MISLGSFKSNPSKIIRCAFSLCVVLAWLTQAVPHEAESQGDVRQLLRLSGAANVVQSLAPLISAQFVASLKQSNPILPERTLGVTTDVVTRYLGDPTRKKDLLDQLAQIYERTFTPQEIQQLIAFYKTPIGRKLAASLPAITDASSQVGQAWAAKILPGLREEVLTRLRAEGLIPK